MGLPGVFVPPQAKQILRPAPRRRERAGRALQLPGPGPEQSHPRRDLGTHGHAQSLGLPAARRHKGPGQVFPPTADGQSRTLSSTTEIAGLLALVDDALAQPLLLVVDDDPGRRCKPDADVDRLAQVLGLVADAAADKERWVI